MSALRDRWQLTDALLPFAGRRLPAGLEGTGRLVRVRVQTPDRAVFSARHDLSGASLGIPVLADFAGEAAVERDGLRVIVSASALSVIVVGALAGVFLLGGLRVFLARPGLGTALLGAALVAAGSWLLRQIPRAGRDVASDAARVLEMMTPSPRLPVRPDGATRSTGAG